MPRIGGYTGDYYAAKQIAPQVVRIATSDAETQVAVPGLKPNFGNTQASTGSHLNDIYYQLRSFSYIPRFYNCEAGMRLRLRVARMAFFNDRWLLSESSSVKNPSAPLDYSTHEVIGANLDDFIEIKLDIVGKQVLTAPELADYVQEAVATAHARAAQEYNQAQITGINFHPSDRRIVNQKRRFLTLFDYANFQYSSETNKIVYYMSNGTDKRRIRRNGFASPAVNRVGNAEVLDWMFCPLAGSTVYLTCDPSMSKDFQIRLSKMLGFSEVIKFKREDGTEVEELGNSFYLNDDQSFAYYSQALPSYWQTAIAANTGVPTPWNEQQATTLAYVYRTGIIPTPYDSTKGLMVMQRHQRIYIRTSMQNNMWRADGSKGDEIAVVPIEAGIDDNIKTYVPTGSDARTYEVRETNAGSVQFNLRITDENDEIVEFLDDYELQMGFFFCPANTMPAQF